MSVAVDEHGRFYRIKGETVYQSLPLVFEDKHPLKGCDYVVVFKKDEGSHCVPLSIPNKMIEDFERVRLSI